MYCTNCGYPLNEGNRFCANCGYPAESFAPPAQPPRPGYGGVPYPTSAQPGVPYPAYNAAYPSYVPAPPPVIPAKPEKSPKAQAMRRAYNLGTLWTVVAFLAQSVIISVALSFAIVILILPEISYYGHYDGILDSIYNILDMLNDESFVTLIGVVYAAAYAAAVPLAFLISKTIRGRVESVIIERRSLGFSKFLRIALIAFGVWGVGILVGNGAQLIVPVDSSSALTNSLPMVLVAIFGAPVFEELLFRKFLIDRLLPFGEKTAVIFTALFFGMAHRNAMQFFLAFFLGLLFAIVYIRTGKIIYTMLLHFMINTVGSLDTLGWIVLGEDIELWCLIGIGVLSAAGIIVAIICRRDEFFKLEPNREPEANWAAYHGWAYIVVKILVVVSIISTSLLYTYRALQSYGVFGLLHLVPGALAVVAVFVISARAARRFVPLPAESAPEAESAPAWEPTEDSE